MAARLLRALGGVRAVAALPVPGRAAAPGPAVPPAAPDEVVALRVLHGVTQRVHASLDLSDTLDAVARGVLEATCFGVVVINLRRETGDFEVVSVEGHPGAREELLGMVEPEEQWSRVLQRAEHWGALRFLDHTLAGVDGDTMLSWVPDAPAVDQDGAWHPMDALFAPLTTSTGVLVGALSVDLPEGGRRPTWAQCEVLELFAEHATLAIEHARMTAALQASRDDMAHAAHHDPLTGLANRALLMERGAEVVAQGGGLGVLVLDLDGFKAVNDTAGHLAGDEVLRVLAARMRSCVRGSDLVARAGGDEFVVVVPLHGGAGAEVTDDLAERMRRACAEPVVGRLGRHQVGVSVGVALSAYPTSFEDVLAVADAEMFAEKRAARRAQA
ncbi:hypothetical protein GCM10027047_32570 [Rhodococcus aerolatus]